MQIKYLSTLTALLLIPFKTSAAINPNEIKLPKGFKLEVLAEVPNAREMALSPSGTLFVGSMGEGKVFAVLRQNLKTTKVLTLVKGQEEPVGVAYSEGDLYFSSVSKIFKLSEIEKHFDKPPKPTLISDKFPTEGHHGWKYIAFGPDGKLYVPIGAPCNVCEKGPSYANIKRMNKDGSGLETYATGIRNTVGFTWHPNTKDLWFTDNGRDHLGDDQPPCELNHAPKKDLHFGFPYCHGGKILDPEFGKSKDCKDYQAPVQNLGAHVAPLGLKFYTGKMFPKEYQNQIFIAEHGSWNRSQKIGYRISLVKLNRNKSTGYEIFADGWHKGEKTIGRPVDVLVDLDGALLVSDDYNGLIYRISYNKGETK